MNIYLDNAATTPLSTATKSRIKSLLDTYGNPSSLHSVGAAAGQIISDARESIAKFINASPEDVYFTPGGSASNTLAIKGYCEKHTCRVLYSPIAHKSILECVKDIPNSHPLKVNGDGVVDFDDLKEWLDILHMNVLVVIDYANSEIGVIQDVKRLVSLIHFYHGVVYLDCTGSIPTVPLDVKQIGADMCGFSGHKLGALKGCGVLYKKKEIELAPLIYGSQEHGLVGGTENLLGIASFGTVVENYDYSSISAENRDYVYNFISCNIPDSYLVGSIENRLPHNLFVCFKGIDGESLLYVLDKCGIQVSTGSACNSKSIVDSTVLTAIGFSKDDIRSCIRMTFSGRETKEELDYICNKLKESVERLRALNESEDLL